MAQLQGQRAASIVAAIVLLGACVACVLVATARLRVSEQQELPFLLQMPAAQQKPLLTEKLWFGPGIADDLTRMVNLGKEMSPKLTDYIKKGLEEQAKMVHWDDLHEGEVDSANKEVDKWEEMGGNNNGGNEPCMKPPGECP